MSSRTRTQPYPLRTFFRDLAERVRPYRVRFWLGSTLRLIGDIAWLYPPIALALIVDWLATYTPGTPLQPIWTALGWMAAATAVRYLGMYAGKRIVFSVSERALLDTELLGLKHLLRLDAGWHEKENTGNKLKRITRGAEGVDRVLRIWANNIIEIMVNFVGIVILLATFDRIIALWTVLFLLSFYVLSHFFISRAARASDRVHVEEERVHGLLFESLNNIRTVQVLHMAEVLYRKVDAVVGGLYEKIKTRIFWYQTGNTVRNVWGHAFRIAVMIYIIIGISEGQYAVGFLVLFVTYFGSLWQSVSELSDVMQDLIVAKYSIGRMAQTLREPVHNDDTVQSVAFPTDWHELSFRAVSFSYEDRHVLDHVSFTLKRGERIGLVGLSGAGKSTLFKLLLREREPTSGGIFIDNHPLNSIRRADYFAHTATVLQDTEVFNFSLRENVVLAHSAQAANETLLRQALETSHVSDFLNKLPEGVDTVIGEKGVKLSGGERQRVGLARAIFKRPDLLLLDEATSHLDVESERKIQASLHDFFQTVTAIVIAHRLTTIKEMDRIIVLEEGHIVEEGSFAQLHAARGRFHELWEQQRITVDTGDA